MSPQTLGRYTIIAELGRGAMGTVYHGIDPTIERPVAIKILNPDLSEEVLDEVKGRFLREAKSAGKLNHPNIVTVYEFGEANGIAYLAMEYLEGKSLHQVMRGERLPYATIATTIAQIADGLDYAHRFGVVHRDIKPANIMVSPHGLVKLTDFGIAHVQSSTMTGAGAMLGSPKYMAPEYVLGKQIDGRADIFSLGIVLYEMLAGRTPFEEGESSTIFSTMQRIVTPWPRSRKTVINVPASSPMTCAISSR
jgi:serine/threonine-protein kinase